MFFIALLLAGTTLSGQVKKAPVVIRGQVIAAATGQPVTNAHVYIIDGEEEALTNSNGEFIIESWQKTPVTITVNAYRQYAKTSVVVANPSQRQVIRLKTQSQ